MKELSLVGFLSRYVRELSMSGTNSVSKLAREAAMDNYRLREALLLCVLFTDNSAMLRGSMDNEALNKQFATILNQYSKTQMLQALKEMIPIFLPSIERYGEAIWPGKTERKRTHRRKSGSGSAFFPCRKKKAYPITGSTKPLT